MKSHHIESAFSDLQQQYSADDISAVLHRTMGVGCPTILTVERGQWTAVRRLNRARRNRISGSK